MLKVRKYTYTRKFLFVVTFLSVATYCAILVARSGWADDRQGTPLPIIDYWPWDKPPILKDLPSIEETISKATATPDDIQAKSLPTVTPSPPRIVQVIDTDPNQSQEGKYGVIVKRGVTGEEVILLMSPDSEFEELLFAYNQHDHDTIHKILGEYLSETDEIIMFGPPLNSGGPRPRKLSEP